MGCRSKMCKNMSRAMRRHHRERLKKTRKNYWGYGNQGYRSYFEQGTPEMSPYQAGVVINTPKTCSCFMCRNQRHNTWQNKKECLTMQERKALINYKYNMEEIDVSKTAVRRT